MQYFPNIPHALDLILSTVSLNLRFEEKKKEKKNLFYIVLATFTTENILLRVNVGLRNDLHCICYISCHPRETNPEVGSCSE